MSSFDRGDILAQFVAATGWSCENGEALLASHDWQLQAALAEALDADTSAHAQLEDDAKRRSSHSQEQFDRDLAAALAASNALVASSGMNDARYEQRQPWQVQDHQRNTTSDAHRPACVSPSSTVVGSSPSVHSQLQRVVMQPGQTVTTYTTGAPTVIRSGQTVLPVPQAPDDVRAFLERAGLVAFIQSFVTHGYDDMAIIRLMGNAEMDELGLKGGHKLKLKEALKSERSPTEVGSSSREAAAQSSGYSAEQATVAPSGPILPSNLSNVEPGRSTTVEDSEVPDDRPQGTADSSSRKAENVLARALGGKSGKPAQKRYIKDGKITYVDE